MNAAHLTRQKCHWIARMWYLSNRELQPETPAILADYHRVPEKIMEQELKKRFEKGGRYVPR